MLRLNIVGQPPLRYLGQPLQPMLMLSQQTPP